MAIRRHALRSEDWHAHKVGDRVHTIDGVPGTVAEVQDGPFPSTENYRVTLDGGYGGGTYSANQLHPIADPTVASRQFEAAVPVQAALPVEAATDHLASIDYPELGDVLYERLPNENIRVFASSTNPPVGDQDMSHAETEPDNSPDDEDTAPGPEQEQDDEPDLSNKLLRSQMVPQDIEPPSSCSYCGSTEFEPPADTGRGQRVKCSQCGGTMSSWGGQWQPNLPNSTDNEPSGDADSRAVINDLSAVRAARDLDLGFHMVASWRDVQAKAKRIKDDGLVRITAATHDQVIGEVQGEHHTYESAIQYVPGSHRIAFWTCGCKWGAYAWGRSPAYKRFEGRKCAHVTALQYEAMSRGMFGQEVGEDRDRLPGQYQRSPVTEQYHRGEERNLNRRTVPPGNMKRTFSKLEAEKIAALGLSESVLVDGGVYKRQPDLELDVAPVHVFAAQMVANAEEPDAILRMLAAHNVAPAQGLQVIKWAATLGEQVLEQLTQSEIHRAKPKRHVNDQNPVGYGWWAGFLANDPDGENSDAQDGDDDSDATPTGQSASMSAQANFSAYDYMTHAPYWSQVTPHADSPNPGSTGFATSQDPGNWSDPLMGRGMHLNADAALHGDQDLCRGCGEHIRRTSVDPSIPWVHSGSGNAFCDVTSHPGHDTTDAVWLAGTPGRDEAHPMWHDAARHTAGEMGACPYSHPNTAQGHADAATHTGDEHSAWAESAHAAGTHDAWGRPLHQPYDGHGAWDCNNYSCAEHPQSLYEQGPGPVTAPGWMLAEHDPHKDLTREVNKAFHDTGQHEDARYLMEQQHTGPTKLSAMDQNACHHNYVHNAHGQCMNCGHTEATEADEPCDHEWCVHNEPEHTKGEHIDPPHLDPYHPDHQSAEHAVNDIFSEHPDAWLLDHQSGGPSHLSSLQVEALAEGVEPPTVSGICLKAADTGRVLMIQRSNKDESDPARGTHEFPGGHHEPGDQTSLHAGIREWEEEVGQPFPAGGHVSHVWRSGPYQGHVVVVPSEDAVALGHGRSVDNPDDPDGDDHEQAMWWEIEHAKKNPALRPELKDAAPWSGIAKAAAYITVDDCYAALGDAMREAGLTDFNEYHRRSMALQEAQMQALLSAEAGSSGSYAEALEHKSLLEADAAERGHQMQWHRSHGTHLEGACTRCGATMTVTPTWSSPGTSGIDARNRACTGQQAVANLHDEPEGALPSTDGELAEDGTEHQVIALRRTAAKDFSYEEQQELISEGAREGARARNFGELQIEGTHYAKLGDLAPEDDTFLWL